MAATFTDSFTASNDSIFRGKITACIAKVASTIAGEAKGVNTEIQWRKRGELAADVLRNPSGWLDQFAIATPATNATIDTSSTDGDIEFQVTAIWDDMAGVTGEDLV